MAGHIAEGPNSLNDPDAEETINKAVLVKIKRARLNKEIILRGKAVNTL